MTDFDYEKKKLDEILIKYEVVLENVESYLKRLPEMYKEDFFLLDRLLGIYENKQRLMKEMKGKPYFARIDFKESSGKVEQCYLGKVGVSDEDNNIITVDWRAPIASIYYDSNIGDVTYDSPGGIVNGELLIKRQIDIEEGVLKRIADVDTVSNDEILKPYLGLSADNRLKNIVATIQGEQNEIIRENLFKNLIIQGVAGSGKTTVALHRIAYLVYNYKDIYPASEFMVIGPNTFFLDYISDVLPDLDASTVVQTTFYELVRKFIKEDINLNHENPEEAKNLSKFKFKSSLKYKELIDDYMDNFDKRVIPDTDFIIKGITILSKETLEKIYQEVDKKVYLNIESRIERTVLLASAYINNNEKVRNRILRNALNAELKTNQHIKKELKNNFKQSLKLYLTKQIKKSITNIYLDFIKNIPDEYSLNNATFKGKKYDFEDLAALAYIKYLINGEGNYQTYRHVVIDEAQDYGEFNFYILKKILKNATFSIYGDLAQSIYSYRSIDSWNSVTAIFSNKINIKKLLKSYRMTIEIMNEANKVINYINLSSAVPVIRHGEDVNYLKITENKYDIIKNCISTYQNKGHQSIALIARDTDEAAIIYNEILKRNILLECIVTSQNKYKGGICVTTPYLAKGLEFDAVLITDASENKYDSKNINDMKLLYVAMTRALHNLDILYDEILTIPLKNIN